VQTGLDPSSATAADLKVMPAPCSQTHMPCCLGAAVTITCTAAVAVAADRPATAPSILTTPCVNQSHDVPTVLTDDAHTVPAARCQQPHAPTLHQSQVLHTPSHAARLPHLCRHLSLMNRTPHTAPAVQHVLAGTSCRGAGLSSCLCDAG
jgi:hypothetical protein